MKKIGDPGLSIYRGADKGLLEKFIKTISEEKQIRDRKSSMDKGPYWIQLQSVIRERIELYTSIFGFCKKDVGHCEIVAERYAKIRDRRIRHRKRLWKIGIGTGAATLAGATALWYIAKKEKKQSDRDKPEKE